jgi:hypothetical protein
LILYQQATIEKTKSTSNDFETMVLLMINTSICVTLRLRLTSQLNVITVQSPNTHPNINTAMLVVAIFMAP